MPPAKRRRLDEPATFVQPAITAASSVNPETSTGVHDASISKPSDISVPLVSPTKALNAVPLVKKESPEATLPPSSQIARQPSLVNQGTYRIHPVPSKYRLQTTDSAKLRERWKKEQAELLQQRGTKARIKVVRTKLL